MTPPFHETFWVAAGTAAPIIGLAAVVTAAELREAINTFREAKDRGTAAHRESAITGLAIADLAYWISSINVLLQAAILSTALTALLARRDRAGGRRVPWRSPCPSACSRSQSLRF